MRADLALVQAIDIVFRARQEECEYFAVFRVNPVELRHRTVVFFVDHASLVALHRAVKPSEHGVAGDAAETADHAADSPHATALDGIGVDREFLVPRRDADEPAMFRELALAWWFDEFERDASPITLAHAALINAVVEAALSGRPEEPIKNHTALARRFAWREVVGIRPMRPL